MLLLSTDLWHYWPVIVFAAAFCIVAFLIAVFLYIDHKDDQKEKARRLATTPGATTPLIPTKSFWRRFLEWVGIKKKNGVIIEDGVEEYKDNYGGFQSIGIPIIIIVIIYLLTTINFNFGDIELPDWLSDLFKNSWFWIGLVVLILLAIFGPSLFKKGRGLNWKWLWIPLLVIAGIWGYKQYQISRFLINGLPNKSSVNHTTQSIPSYPQMMVEEENKFQVGQLTKSFRLKNFGPDYYPVPVGRNDNDTVTVSFSGPSGSWKYKTWVHKGKVGYEEIVPQSAFVAGDHTITVNKPGAILWTTKVPPLL